MARRPAPQLARRAASLRCYNSGPEEREGVISRLVTRGDLDGLACAAIVTSCEKIDWVRLVHPQQIVHKEITITREDILANLPYHPDARLWFDNDLATASDTPPPEELHQRYASAPSAAHVVYDHYIADHPEIERFMPLLEAVDRLDSGRLTRDDIVDPRGYVLLGFTLDPRTGLGGLDDYFHVLLEGLKEEGLDAILEYPELQERERVLREQDRLFREAIQKRSRQEGNVVITDFRDEEKLPVGNRFTVYTIYPDTNVSVRLQWGPVREGIVVSVGRSILNRTASVDVGGLMARYGGGGHVAAGSCMLSADTADTQIAEIVAALKE
jgi:nanoRNase/pAp phosphatase (c-di-AMP/oligoRNAs hydrolase)